MEDIGVSGEFLAGFDGQLLDIGAKIGIDNSGRIQQICMPSREDYG